MPKISKTRLAKMFQRLATSYTAGIDLRTILKRETETGSTGHRVRLQQVVQGVSAGKSLAQSMRDTGGYFPELAMSVVHAGERGGRLDESFRRLAEHYASLVQFRNRFMAALAWPAFQFIAAVLIVGGLMAICDSIFTTMEMEKFNWLLMGSTAGNVIAYYVLVLLAMIAATIIVMGTSRGWFGTLPMKIARRIPLIGKTIESLALSRFAWTMSMAENAGMNPVEIAQLSLRSTENYFYKRLEPAVCQSLQAGNPFYQTLKSTGAFPDDLLIYVDNGETAGELAESMDRASHEYQENANNNLKIIGTVGFVMMLVSVALLVLVILVFAVQQYVNMLNSLM